MRLISVPEGNDLRFDALLSEYLIRLRLLYLPLASLWMLDASYGGQVLTSGRLITSFESLVPDDRFPGSLVALPMPSSGGDPTTAAAWRDTHNLIWFSPREALVLP